MNQQQYKAVIQHIDESSFLDGVFDISLFVKAVDGGLELIGGILLFFLSPGRLNAVVRLLTQHELTEDPHDFIATHLVSYAHSFTVSASIFLAFYLITHGVVKLFLASAVLWRKLWAYPWMIGFLAIFIAYQLYLLALHISVALVALTIFDILIVILTIIEYRKYKRQLIKEHTQL